MSTTAPTGPTDPQPSAAPTAPTETTSLSDTTSPDTTSPSGTTRPIDTTSPTGAQSPEPPAAPRGPAPLTVFSGLVGLLVALGAFLVATLTVDVDWGRLGPGLVIGVGAVIVLLGLLGIRADRRS
ncbi:MAG TPA: hypothetical protein VES95_12235 [Dermatophilaceae bacterium]|nr:hypothetical protein [Dermatophilaceae bacterium]